MAVKSRRRSYQKQRKSRNQQKNKRSRRLNLRGGGDSVSMLYVKGSNSEIYELISVADNIQDLLLLARDVPENMVSSFKQSVMNNMYVQITFLNGPCDITQIRPFNPLKTSPVKGQTISSNDESILFYTDDGEGRVLAIYNKEADIKHAYPNAHIKSIKKNTMNWDSTIFE